MTPLAHSNHGGTTPFTGNPNRLARTRSRGFSRNPPNSPPLAAFESSPSIATTIPISCKRRSMTESLMFSLLSCRCKERPSTTATVAPIRLPTILRLRVMLLANLFLLLPKVLRLFFVHGRINENESYYRYRGGSGNEMEDLWELFKMGLAPLEAFLKALIEFGFGMALTIIWKVDILETLTVMFPSAFCHREHETLIVSIPLSIPCKSPNAG
ncbi:hypothetical protein L2E82_32293 [Cichorium intybus]|uniref:Uncharacterized protein n=1 Tax=Cichorium intybus TaxID=13427 RepID=A0ACB9BGU2_CICIN|nr:hypothetical protein L2E82_32293 [Cichorium intybus]